MHNYEHSKVSSEEQKYTAEAGNWQDLPQGRVLRHRDPLTYSKDGTIGEQAGADLGGTHHRGLLSSLFQKSRL